MGPAGFVHRVIKCQSPMGRLQQLPGLQIRVAKEAGCAQGQEAARPGTAPAWAATTHAAGVWVCICVFLQAHVFGGVEKRKGLGMGQKPGLPSLGYWRFPVPPVPLCAGCCARCWGRSCSQPLPQVPATSGPRWGTGLGCAGPRKERADLGSSILSGAGRGGEGKGSL